MCSRLAVNQALHSGTAHSRAVWQSTQQSTWLYGTAHNRALGCMQGPYKPGVAGGGEGEGGVRGKKGRGGMNSK